MLNILVMHDDPDMHKLIVDCAETVGNHVQGVAAMKGLYDLLFQPKMHFDKVIMQQSLVQQNIGTLIATVKKRWPNVKFSIVSGNDNIVPLTRVLTSIGADNVFKLPQQTTELMLEVTETENPHILTA